MPEIGSPIASTVGELECGCTFEQPGRYQAGDWLECPDHHTQVKITRADAGTTGVIGDDQPTPEPQAEQPTHAAGWERISHRLLPEVIAAAHQAGLDTTGWTLRWHGETPRIVSLAPPLKRVVTALPADPRNAAQQLEGMHQAFQLVAASRRTRR